MIPSISQIQTLIEKGQKKQARTYLKQMLKDNPSADAWYMAALSVESDTEKIKCLKKALQFDALHTPANRLYQQLNNDRPKDSRSRPKKNVALIDRDRKVSRVQQQRKSGRRRKGIGCLVSLLLSMSISVVTLSAVGMIPGAIGALTRLSSGVAPVYEIDDAQIATRDDSVFQIEPVVSKPLTEQDLGFIDHGYVHEYYFEAVVDRAYGVYLQFLSLNAHNLRRNVAILDANGNNVTPDCDRQAISEYENGVAYVCVVNVSGRWSIRVLGIRDESTGGYVVGLQDVP